MNNRFKFRSWHEPTKTMEYNGLWTGRDWDKKLSDCNFKLMQSTGLKDKNGKLIYEGDILLDYVNHIRICVFEDGMFKFPALKTSRYYSKPQKNHRADRQNGILKKLTFQDELTKKNKKKLEVIGNIYENKELLNE